MEFLIELWLPIVLSAVFVFVASSVLHMCLPFHRSDYAKLPAEDKLLESMRSERLEPGAYMFPHSPSMKELGSPEMIAKFEQGPVGFTVILPSGPPAMGKTLVKWFFFTLVMSVFVAYITKIGLGPGAEYLTVFRVSGAVAVVGYCMGPISDSIWKGQSCVTTAKFIFDGVVYGLVTAGTFGWLWPVAA